MDLIIEELSRTELKVNKTRFSTTMLKEKVLQLETLETDHEYCSLSTSYTDQSFIEWKIKE